MADEQKEYYYVTPEFFHKFAYTIAEKVKQFVGDETNLLDHSEINLLQEQSNDEMEE